MSASFEQGFRDLEKKLNKLGDNARNLDGTRDVSFSDLFAEDFMQGHTSFASVYDFLRAGNFDVSSQEAYRAISDDEIDAYVRTRTEFNTWRDMMQAAANDYAKRKLFDGTNS